MNFVKFYILSFFSNFFAEPTEFDSVNLINFNYINHLFLTQGAKDKINCWVSSVSIALKLKVVLYHSD